MKTNIPLIHNIEERTLEEVKQYYQPEIFIKFCKSCEYYNKIWACPPYDFDITKMLNDYKYIYVVGSKLYINDLDESFKELLDNDNLDYVSNEIFKAARLELDQKILAIENIYKDVCVLLAGRCLMCNNCTREKQLPCSYPEKMHYSLESIGFDVSSICEDILGNKMLWSKESLPEYFILISAILSNKKLDVEDVYHIMDVKHSQK